MPVPEAPRTTNKELKTRPTHAANLIQAADDLPVPAKEDGRVRLLERLPSPVGCTVRIIGRRPDKVFRADAGLPQSPAQALKALRAKFDRPFQAVDRDSGDGPVTEEVAALPFPGDPAVLRPVQVARTE